MHSGFFFFFFSTSARIRSNKRNLITKVGQYPKVYLEGAQELVI